MTSYSTKSGSLFWFFSQGNLNIKNANTKYSSPRGNQQLILYLNWVTANEQLIVALHINEKEHDFRIIPDYDA